MCAGLPVIADEYFEWMVGEKDCLADLEREGALAQKIEEVLAGYEGFRKKAKRIQANAIERFDWGRLIPRYLAMYEQVRHV